MLLKKGNCWGGRKTATFQNSDIFCMNSKKAVSTEMPNSSRKCCCDRSNCSSIEVDARKMSSEWKIENCQLQSQKIELMGNQTLFCSCSKWCCFLNRCLKISQNWRKGFPNHWSIQANHQHSLKPVSNLSKLFGKGLGLRCPNFSVQMAVRWVVLNQWASK